MKEWATVKHIRRGLNHIEWDLKCQDKIRVQENERCLVAVLSDGVGSLPNSDIAAEAVVGKISALLCSDAEGVEAPPIRAATPAAATDTRNLSVMDTIRLHIVRIAAKAIRARAEQDSLPLSSMDCTLAFVRIDKRRGTALAGVLGDGAICVIRRGEASEAITNSASSANATYTVLGENAAEHMVLKNLDVSQDAFCGFLLTSDGLENELYMKSSDYVYQAAGEYLNSLLDEEDPEDAVSRRIDRLTAFRDTPFDDDISLIGIGRLKEPVHLPADPTWLCVCMRRNPLQSACCLSCGRDLEELYGETSIGEYASRDAFFRRLNSHPQEEEELIQGIIERIEGTSRKSAPSVPNGAPSSPERVSVPPAQAAAERVSAPPAQAAPERVSTPPTRTAAPERVSTPPTQTAAAEGIPHDARTRETGKEARRAARGTYRTDAEKENGGLLHELLKFISRSFFS